MPGTGQKLMHLFECGVQNWPQGCSDNHSACLLLSVQSTKSRAGVMTQKLRAHMLFQRTCIPTQLVIAQGLQRPLLDSWGTAFTRANSSSDIYIRVPTSQEGPEPHYWAPKVLNQEARGRWDAGQAALTEGVPLERGCLHLRLEHCGLSAAKKAGTPGKAGAGQRHSAGHGRVTEERCFW